MVREWGIRANLRPPPGVLLCLAARRSRVLSICCVSKKVETPRQPVFCRFDDEKEMPKKEEAGVVSDLFLCLIFSVKKAGG